jgi:hypothetical protein
MRTIAVSTVIGLAAGFAGAQNILTNPGFESGALSPWYANFGAPFVTMDEAHSGVYSAAAFGSDSIRQDFAPVPAVDLTEVSIWVKRLGGAFDSYTFYYDDGSQEDHLLNDIGGGDDWKFHDLTPSLNLSKNLSGFSIFGTSSGPAYFDDVTIVPVPSSLALLGIGGLAASRRRR